MVRWRDIGYVPMAISLAVLGLLTWQMHGSPNAVTGGAIALVILVAISMSSMTVEILPDHIAWWFSFGVLRRTVRHVEMVDVSVGAFRPFLGYGIRLVSGGTLWCVGGGSCLEITRKTGGAIFLASSHVPEMLSALRAQGYPVTESDESDVDLG